MFDEDILLESFERILGEIDPHPNREGLQETPRRMLGYFKELFEGALYTNQEIAKMFDKEFEVGSKDLVVMNGIHCFSHCEHHCALMELTIHIAYIPNNGKVLGLSKFPRICDMVCKRLQIQERIGMDICDVLECLGMEDVMVVIDGRHACVNARGIKQPETITRTNCVRGVFDYSATLKDEVLNSIERSK